MTFISFTKRFLLHGVWALTATVVAMLGMEFLIPGSVTPYADPLPWAVIAIAALSVDAMLRPVAKRRWLRLVIGAVLLILSLLLMSSGISAWGKSTSLLLIVTALMIGGTIWFISSLKASS